MKDVSVVVVTYREGVELLSSCFDSVYAQKDVDFELIVVDNGSDVATEQLLRRYTGARYIKNPENRGFAAAVNQGMKEAKGRYVLLLNPDTSFNDQVFANMIQRLDEDVEVGVGSCIIRYPNGELQKSIRRFPTLKDQLLVLLKIPHFFDVPAIKKYMYEERDPFETQDVDSIMGAFMWIRREVLDRVGLFDERYFIWFEEVDYCKMVSDAGWVNRHYADVEITHHKGHTFSKIATFKKQRWIRQSLRKYMRKHHGLLPWILLWVLTPLFVVIAFFAAVVKRT